MDFIAIESGRKLNLKSTFQSEFVPEGSTICLSIEEKSTEAIQSEFERDLLSLFEDDDNELEEQEEPEEYETVEKTPQIELTKPYVR